ncbi:MAG: DNA cytosine methyltransferase [Syntrophobacteraceae bacterium]
MMMPDQLEECSIERIRELGESKGYGVVDSFCGPGGISLGLERAGFTPLLAFDKDEMAVETYNHNLRNNAIVADASRITGSEISSMIDVPRGELALFTGGPPCQGFSKQKRGAHLGDKRNTLIFEYIRLVNELYPRFFMFENVAIFGQKRGSKYVDEMDRQLGDYVTCSHYYNSADYGLPQTRQRFITVGMRKDQQTFFIIPCPTTNRWKTVGEVLAGIPEPPEDFSDHPDLPNHQRARVTDINIKRFSFVPQGGGWQDIPEEYRLECHKKADTKSGGWPDVYGRLDWKGQCPTITGGFDSFTRGRYGHPLHDRPLTPREAAMIQGFPNWFIFKGTRADIRSQIGNAVPPPLAEAIGLSIAQSLLVADGILDGEAFIERTLRNSNPLQLSLYSNNESASKKKSPNGQTFIFGNVEFRRVYTCGMSK